MLLCLDNILLPKNNQNECVITELLEIFWWRRPSAEEDISSKLLLLFFGNWGVILIAISRFSWKSNCTFVRCSSFESISTRPSLNLTPKEDGGGRIIAAAPASSKSSSSRAFNIMIYKKRGAKLDSRKSHIEPKFHKKFLRILGEFKDSEVSRKIYV